MNKYLLRILIVVLILLLVASVVRKYWPKEAAAPPSEEEVEMDLGEKGFPQMMRDVSEEGAGEHLRFKGVPIDGSLKEFTVRMREAGFRLVEAHGGEAVMRGDFAGYKDCYVYVATLEGKNLVSRVTATFPSRDTWGALYGDYKNLKSMLGEKYGKPASVTERFQDLFVNNDGDRFFAVQTDRCKYESLFRTPKGTIVLWIAHNGSSSCYAALAYTDRLNGSAVKSHAIDDL